MHIQVNGEEREVSLNLSLQALINHLNLAPERIAIELNQTVVRRSDWPATLLAEDDRVEIVHFVGGGAPHGRQTAGGRRQTAEGQEVLFLPVSCPCFLPSPPASRSRFLFSPHYGVKFRHILWFT